MKKLVQLCLSGAVACAALFVQGGTVAYWPMELNPATGGTARTIADVSGHGYDLRSELSDAQARTSSDIPFAAPPNGPVDVTAASCAEIVNGTTLAVNAFSRGTGNQTQTIDPLVLAMGLRRSFTLEGYMYVKSLKHGDGADTIIAFSGVNGNSDWIWNLTEPKANSNTRNVVLQIRGGGAGLSGGGVLATIDDAEIVGGWHHYALVFKFNADNSRSLWTFYLDGVNRGSQTMPNHANATQHDRFLLGGVNSGAHKTFDAKLAFWRVSDEALDSNALLCHRTFGTTVAYWPMNVFSGFHFNALRSIVPDSVDARNSLMVRDPGQGGVSWSASDAGWTLPPNPDAEFAAAGIRAPSGTMVRSGNNTTKIGNQYREVFSVVSDAPVIAATMLTKSFTLEGYVKFATLPADSSQNQTFAYNTLGEHGGWIWNLYGPDAKGNLAVKLLSNLNGNRPAVTLGDRFRPEELLNVWNHYALTFTPDNGRGQTEWRFYLNGRLRGKSNAMAAFAPYTFNSPLFFISGARSGANPQALLGDMTCWRVSSKALKPTELLCGGEEPSVPADALVWKGSASSGEWSTGAVANWTADGEPTAWTDAKDAYFDDTFAADTARVVGTVNPASINVQADANLKVAFGADSAIGAGCTNFVKRGFGSFELSYTGNTVKNLFTGACPIEVREGTLRVNAVNSNGGLGDAAQGYEVKVFEHATISLYGRNAIGSGVPDVANNSVFTVYTNGTFDTYCGTEGMGVQALGALDLLGGDFGAPARCHSLGYLLVRNRLTLGLRPNRRPYVFPNVLNQDGKSYVGGITVGRATEFRVEDVTGDGASDGIFDCPVLARTRDGWQNAQNPCGFRKTGAGTMELNGTFLDSSFNELRRPSGVIAVEAGELKVNVDYRGPSKFAVADGAFLSGTGKVSTVEFAAGAGLRVDAGKDDLLELASAAFTGAGVIEIAGVPAADVANLKVACAKVAGAATGTANLAGWTVKVDGEAVPLASVRISNGVLKAAVAKGTVILVR